MRIGFTAVAGYRLLPDLIARARDELPDIETTLHEMVSVAQVDALRSGAIDIALQRPLAGLDADPDRIEPHLGAAVVAPHLDLDDRCRPGYPRRSEAGEPQPAGPKEVPPCHHCRAAYLRLAALSGDTYHTTMW